jgi:DNA (cytosine-5)-methyltransferase 1
MRFAEFFAGIGLMRMGLEAAGWECAYANDIDPKKWQMYDAHFPGSEDHFALGDIREIDAETLPDVDLATASFPCTDLSLAGGRAGLAGEHSSALWPFLEILEARGTRRPPIVLLENVTGFLTSHGGSDLRSALLGLNRLGYAVDMFVLDAARFVPQSRPRFFIVGRLADAGPLVSQPSVLRPAAIAKFIRSNQDVVWNMTDLPEPPLRQGSLAEVLEQLPEGSKEWWSEERAAYLLSQMNGRHRATAEEMIQAPVIGVGSVFRRVRKGRSMAELRTDGIAGCLRTPKGGSARQILFVAGQGRYRVRLLTPRECARLMGAADYRLEVSGSQALFGFGDAVCVPVIEWIANNYLNKLYQETRSPVGAA